MDGAPSMTPANCNDLAKIDTLLEAKRRVPPTERTLDWWDWVDQLLDRRLRTVHRTA